MLKRLLAPLAVYVLALLVSPTNAHADAVCPDGTHSSGSFSVQSSFRLNLPTSYNAAVMVTRSMPGVRFTVELYYVTDADISRGNRVSPQNLLVRVDSSTPVIMFDQFVRTTNVPWTQFRMRRPSDNAYIKGHWTNLMACLRHDGDASLVPNFRFQIANDNTCNNLIDARCRAVSFRP